MVEQSLRSCDLKKSHSKGPISCLMVWWRLSNVRVSTNWQVLNSVSNHEILHTESAIPSVSNLQAIYFIPTALNLSLLYDDHKSQTFSF